MGNGQKKFWARCSISARGTITKPLGTQLAVNAYQWLPNPQKWQRAGNVISKEDAVRAYTTAMSSMSRLNRNGARLMRQYAAHGATDVTGFGYVGHARNLARNQRVAVHFGNDRCGGDR